MYDYLRGVVAIKRDDSITVDVRDIGHRVHCRSSEIEQMVIGEEYTFYTSFQMNESGIRLYGFLDEVGLEVFEHLITVTGIGPKNAMTILSGCSVSDIVQAVQMQDTDFLVKIPGIGKKTAGRIILELDQKLDQYGSTTIDEVVHVPSKEDHIVIDALMNLGFARRDIEGVLETVEPDMGIEEVIKYCLQQLAKEI